MMLESLQSLPDGLAETSDAIAQLDGMFLGGFVGGPVQGPLAALGRIFAGSPLEPLLAASLPALAQGELQERHFVALAAARAALQGAQHDALRGQALAALGRASAPDEVPAAPAAPTPMLEGVRHWLMELAITGFARLEPSTIRSFLPSLAQLREQPELASLAYLLTGFTSELLGALPVAKAEDVPLQRWADMWAGAMLRAAGAAQPAEPQPVSGTLYPLGLELREHDQLISVVFYALLDAGGSTSVVRITRSRFKVMAIGGDMIWLLFPELALLIEALGQGQALALADMPQMPNGDLLWDAQRASLGGKCRLLDVAAPLLAPQTEQAVASRPAPALERHPVLLAEPVVLAGHALGEQGLSLGGAALPLDPRWDVAQLPAEEIGKAAKLFGLLRWDAGRWAFQPLSAATAAGKLAFVGQSAVKLYKKPPKSNPVAILEERASRLLRK